MRGFIAKAIRLFQYLGSRGAQRLFSPIFLSSSTFQYLGSRGAQQFGSLNCWSIASFNTWAREEPNSTPMTSRSKSTVSILGLARSPTPFLIIPITFNKGFNTWAREEPNPLSEAVRTALCPFQYLGSRGAQLDDAIDIGIIAVSILGLARSPTAAHQRAESG